MITKKSSFVYKIEGMHCPSCELLIEQEIKKLPGIVSAEANLAKQSVEVEFTGVKPEPELLYEKIKPYGYKLASLQSDTGESARAGKPDFTQLLTAFGLAIMVLVVFGLLENLSMQMTSQLVLQGAVTYFILGVIASLVAAQQLSGA